MASATLLLLLSAICLASVQSEIVQLYSIHRHGARNVLPKTALLQENDAFGGPTLLPQGERMCYDAGTKYRERYLDPTTCAVNNTCLANPSGDANYGEYPLQGFHNYNTFVRSSYLDRTLMSAMSFFTGAFPPTNATVFNATFGLPTHAQIVPVYSQPDPDDLLIRAYTKCPTYDQTLTNWYQSPVFLQKAADSAQLRNNVSLPANTNRDLTNWWNVYDALSVWRTYHVGNPQPDVDDATFAQVKALAYWLETSKMSSDLTGNLLGGRMLGDLLTHLDNGVAAVQQQKEVYYKVLSMSAHYNVQLGVLAALKMDKYPPAQAALPWLAGTLPELASVMVFELHSDGLATNPAFAVRLAVQQGSKADYVTVPMPCAVPGDEAEQVAGKGACTYTAFRNMTAAAAITTDDAWCQACSNTAATVCQLVQQETLASAASASQQHTKDRDLRLALGLGISMTFLATLLVTGAIFGLVLHRSRRNGRSQLENSPSFFDSTATLTSPKPRDGAMHL